jgi:phosphatidylglycerophosphatase A
VRRLHRAVATVLGLGFVPWAPGTAGSLVGLALAWLLALAGGPWIAVAGALAVAGVGLVSAGRTAEQLGLSDPPPVIIDEVAGQMIALLFFAPRWPALLCGFVLFRLFDVLKPYPLRRLEELPAGLGIMADDLAAGVCSNLAQRLLHWGFPSLWGAA